MKPPHPEKNSERLKAIFKKLTQDEARLISQVISRDPLADLYPWAMLIYAVSMALLVFWPFDFDFTGKTNHAGWQASPPGIEFKQEGQVISPSAPEHLYERLIKGRGLTIELWVHPANVWQGENGVPARLISYSIDPYHRNFMLAQRGTDLSIWLRTENTTEKGTLPRLLVSRLFSHAKPIHLVVSYDFEEQRIFVDGDLLARSSIPGGNFRNWDPQCRLVMGNETTGDRPWLGSIAYAAVYDRPLEASEVRTHYTNVKNWVSGAGPLETQPNPPLVQYRLDEKQGRQVADSGTLATPLTLEIPKKIKTPARPFLETNHDYLVTLDSYAGYEMLLNVFLFIPYTFFLQALLANRIKGYWKAVLLAIVLGGVTTLSVEILQHFSLSRYSSLIDVGTNLSGVLLGILLKVIYDALLYRKKRMITGLLTPEGPVSDDRPARSSVE